MTDIGKTVREGEAVPEKEPVPVKLPIKTPATPEPQPVSKVPVL